MNTLVKEIQSHGLGNTIFTDRQLAGILGGSRARRYGLVNRALKSENLVRLKRGIYCLPTSITKTEFLPHPFGVAQAFVPSSYVSFETSLRYHNWIPEAVYTTASVTPNGKSVRYLQDILGYFTYAPLAVNKHSFLNGVSQYKFDQQAAYVARPLRAVMDIVAQRNVDWTGLGYIEDDLRIEDEDFLELTEKDFTELQTVYKHKPVNNFLAQFEKAVLERKKQPNS